MISTSSLQDIHDSSQISRPFGIPILLPTGKYGSQTTPHGQVGIFRVQITAHIPKIEECVNRQIHVLRSKYPNLDIRSGLHTTESHNLQLVALCKESPEQFGFLRIRMTKLVQPDSRSKRAYIRFEATPLPF